MATKVSWSAWAACACLMAAGQTWGREVHVSPAGDDAGDGSAGRPLPSLQAAARRLSPADVCLVHSGRYQTPLVLNGLKGRPDKPIVFRAAPDQRPVLDGTVPIQARWNKRANGIWQAQLDHDIWQLFAGDEMLTLARWPNITMADEHFWNQKVNYRKFGGESTFGLVVDARPGSDSDRKDFLEDEGVSLGVALPDGLNTQTLAETGVDMTGAIAILNMGSWMTWAQSVERHQAGSNSFTYSTDFSGRGRSEGLARAVQKWCGNEEWWVGKNIKAGQGHYFLEGLACLDRPGEWWFDHKTRTLYLIPPSGRTPEQMLLRGKVVTYMLDLKDCSHVVFDGIGFFGATFRLNNCDHVTVENAALRCPNTSRRVLDDLGEIPCTVLESPKGRTEPNRNVIRNCRFAFADGGGLVIQRDRGDLIENCLFHDIDYSCIGDGMTVRIRGEDTTFRRCTIYNAGGSECVAGIEGTHIQLCHFWNIGKLQHDGTATQFGSFQEPVEVDHCWSRHHPKNGFRFDGGGGPPRPPSQFGTMHHNVTWDTLGLTVKGDRHLIHNNVVWQTFKKLTIMVHAPMNGVNRETVTINNIARKIDTRWWGKGRPPVPGIVKANLLAEADQVLRDPENRDFRPRADAKQVIDAGVVDEARACRYFKGIEHLGKAPDIGAYEHGATSYWIPGFQYPHASTPVPPDGATGVKPDADLMFLEGYKATTHVVYFGASPDGLERKAALADTNIYTPPALESGKTYCWRADAVRGGRTEPGPVWRFRVR